MATKDYDLSFGGGKSKDFDNIASNENHQYRNLNLNKAHKCDTVNSFQAESKLTYNGRKNYDSTNVDKNNLKYKNDFNPRHKNTKHTSLEDLNLYNSVNKESEKQWKTDKNSTLNNSTLSLHIAAYENSVNVENIENKKDMVKLRTNKNRTFEKTWKNVKHVLTGTFSATLMSPFEIPRQQENQTNEPEIMQFKASQKLCNPNEIDSTKTVAATDYTTRACLGRIAKIGDIYDLTTEQILPGANIFKEKLPNDFITITKNHSISSEFITSNKISDKLSALNVSGELSLSLMAGLIKGFGAIECIDEKIYAKDAAVQSTFIQRIRTIDEKINLNLPQMKHLISSSNFGELNGTHVVVGISWGTNTALSMAYNYTINDSQTALAEKQLQHVCDKFKKLSIENDSNEFVADDIIFENGDGLMLNIYADLTPEGLKIPTNLKEAKEYFNQMAQSYANFKGTPMELILLPLNIVQRVFGLQQNFAGNRISNNIEMPTIKRLEQLFDIIYQSSANFENLVKLCTENEGFFAEEDKNEVKNYANKFESGVNEMRGELAVLVQNVRSGNAEAYEIDVLRGIFEKNPLLSSSKIVDSCKYLNEKVRFINECQQNHILMITDPTQLENIKHDNLEAEIFVMFCSFKTDHLLPEWKENIDAIFGLQNQFGTNILGIFDTDVLSNVEKDELVPNGMHISQYFNGHCITNDYMQLQKTFNSQNTVLCENNMLQQNGDEKNIKAVEINFPCPKCFNNGLKEWVCERCRQKIEYNIDDGKLYCDCGSNYIKEFAFKCSDPGHGNEYVKFSENILAELVQGIKPLQEINILVIGETGVGKSTWINALANYISYDSIQDVLNNENNFINLIPTQFEITEKQPNGELYQKSIKVGESKNENFTEGQSATQTSKAYTFRHNKCLYRIIDTPGIGDSRGIDQDKKNMENIMQFISLYKEIHGICVLMRPNEARITPSFEFCFKELLVQFHRSAVENIVFCFPQTSGFNFEVGQTLTPLTVLLDQIEKKQQITIPKTDERMYAFDNMAYRYLCAVKQSNYEFPPDQRELYHRSYDISRDVSRKMLNYFMDRKGHNVEESMSIYRARNIIRRLTHPMAMINTAVEETIEKFKNKQSLIQRFCDDEEKLREILIKQIPFKRWYFEAYTQYYCETCATTEYYYDDDRLQFVEAYPSVMDKNPFILETPDQILTRKKNKCPNCGPNTKKVKDDRWLHNEMGTRMEEDVTVAGQMKEKLKTREGIEEEIAGVEKLKNELIAENDAIVKASARFAYFLGKYSITPYNDATEKYLKLLIQKEERMGSESKKILYENLLSQYDAEKIALEKQLQNSSSKFAKITTIKTSDIMEIVERLKNLKHYGRDIARALGECDKAILYEASAEEMEVSLPNQKVSKVKEFFSRASKFVKRNFI